MRDAFAAKVAADGNDAEIIEVLEETCRLTGMGFAAVARVTEDRWIACQLIDKIDFGMGPGGELEIKKTICNDIRECGKAIVIDEVAIDPEWKRHPVPAIYGFESYVSLPIFLEDQSFYGTLCAIDPHPRALSARDTIGQLQPLVDRLSAILSAKSRN